MTIVFAEKTQRCRIGRINFRYGHPEATDATIELIKKYAKGKSPYSYY